MDPITKKRYKYWRKRILFTITLGYAAFYFLRISFSVTLIPIEEHFQISKTEIGVLLAIQAFLFGVGKTFWGPLSDKFNARYFLTFGLLSSSIVTLLLSFASSFSTLVFLFVISGCLLSIGSGPCIKLLTHWFSPYERATKWAFWNASQQIGAAISVIFGSFVLMSEGWQGVFFYTSLVGLLISVIIFLRLADTPKTLGLPVVEEYKGYKILEEDTNANDLSMIEIIKSQLIKNKRVWIMCCANAFFYIFRMGILQWAPTFLREFKGSSIEGAAFRTAMFDSASIFGGIFLGYLSDKIFEGKRSPIAFISVILLSVFLYLLLIVPTQHRNVHSLLMIGIGFFISCPQILIGVAAAEFSSNRVAATANGMVGFFGYLGASFSNIIVGYIAENHGWEFVFMFFIGAAIISSLFFVLSWDYRSKELENR